MRDYRGRYSQKRMTAVDRIVVLGLATFTISLGWSISHFSETTAVASDLPSLDSVAVQSEIVSNSPELVETMQTAGEATPQPVQAIAPLTQKQEILNYIVEVFGDDAADAIVVIRKCENSSFNPRAINQNRNGSVDRGIFQLNSAYWGGEELFDWKTNVDVAYKVFTRAGKKWTPWTCAHVVDQKNYLNQ
jgi:hypothetical protein